LKVGLALGGGAGLGWAHIGVIRVLEEYGIPIDIVAGTSIGAIVGAGVAADIMDEMEDVARAISLKDMLAMGEFGFNKGSLIGAGKVEKKLREHFGLLKIEELTKPFAAIAADLYSGNIITLTEGDLVTALRASSAVPGVLPPVETNRLFLVDGGIVDPIPVDAARGLGADRIIAVDLQGDYLGRAKRMGFDPGMGRPKMAPLKTARTSWALALQALSRAKLLASSPDVTVVPRIGHIDMTDFTKADELIGHGMQATYAVMPEIEALLTLEAAQ